MVDFILSLLWLLLCRYCHPFRDYPNIKLAWQHHSHSLFCVTWWKRITSAGLKNKTKQNKKKTKHVTFVTSINLVTFQLDIRSRVRCDVATLQSGQFEWNVSRCSSNYQGVTIPTIWTTINTCTADVCVFECVCVYLCVYAFIYIRTCISVCILLKSLLRWVWKGEWERT